jgi:hypothetical protein
MSDYKRLTKRICGAVVIEDEFGNDISTFYKPLGDALDRLAELEDKIEQGTLIELDMKLPFKVGDTAYWLNGLPNCIQEYKVLGYSFDCFFGLRVDLGGMQPILFRCFGVKLFASRKEAEKRLKELQE